MDLTLYIITIGIVIAIVTANVIFSLTISKLFCEKEKKENKKHFQMLMEKGMTDPNFGTICLCAMRYALNKQTSMPGLSISSMRRHNVQAASLVQDFIRTHIMKIDDNTIRVMICEIEEADRIEEHKLPDGRVIKIDGLGDTVIDRPDWLRFLEFLKERVQR